MKILQIGTTDNSGGAAAVSWYLKEELQKKGHKTPMFVSKKRSKNKDVFSIPKLFHKYFHYFLSNDVDFFNTDWIIKTKEFKEADIIHLHNIHGWFFNLKTLEKMSKLKPIVWTLHDMWAITPHCAYSYDGKLENGFYQCPSRKLYPRIFWPNEKYLSYKKEQTYKNSDFNLIVPSLWLKDKVANSILKNKNINLIHNGIDENIFKLTDKNQVRKELDLPSDKKIILFLANDGKYNPAKGWQHAEFIINNYRDKNTIFICLGEKESRVDENNKNLFYIEKTYDKSLVAKYFSAVDVFLFPSLADNCPLVALEAMACGLPIVTFDTGGIPELVTHKENGYVAKYKDSDDLMLGLKYILNLDSNQIQNISKNSREKVMQNFTADKMVDNYEILYRKIIKDFKDKKNKS